MDIKHFPKFYTENYHGVLTHVLTYVRDEGKAEDITADAFMKAYNHFEEFNPKVANFLTWMKRIARNTFIDDYRTDRFAKNTTSQENYVDEEGEYLIQPMADEEADSEVICTEMREQILGAIRSLKPTYRKVAVLYFLNELKYKEIAKVTDMPMNSVKVAISRARVMLQTALA